MIPLPPFLDRLRKTDFWARVLPSDYKIPTHGNGFFYCLGGIVAIGFFIMIGTGLLLTQIYNPVPDAAYESLQTMQQNGLISYLRALHYWVAQGMIIALLLHLARVFITGAYKCPRQATWWVGVTLLAIMLMGSYFTGTILKWDEEGLDALSHYREALMRLGPIGAMLTESLSGSAPMNFRVYVSHITIFPLLLIGLIGLHIYLIRVFRLSPTPSDQWADQIDIPESEMQATFHGHGKNVAAFAMLYYGWLAVLAFFVRAPLGGPPTPDHGALKPPWPFLWMYGFENKWGIVSVVYASSIFFVLLALIPLLDRQQDRRFRARKGILTLGAIVAIALFGLTLHGYITPPQIHLSHHTHGGEDGHNEQGGGERQSEPPTDIRRGGDPIPLPGEKTDAGSSHPRKGNGLRHVQHDAQEGHQEETHSHAGE
jgi:ubiquinol-cytochrome c reductase cytochrome b subunit